MTMKIIIVAVISTMFSVATCGASKATESNQLIDKMTAEPKFEPQKALVYFVQIKKKGLILYKAGGALLSGTYAVTTSRNLIDFITESESISELHVGFGAMSINQNFVENDHSVEKIIPESATEIDECSTLALAILKDLSDNPDMPKPTVQYIPLATRSYTPGEHDVNEFFIGWNKEKRNSMFPVNQVDVDLVGNIFIKIDTNYPEGDSTKLYNFRGGFLTRGGTLAGIIVNLLSHESNGGLMAVKIRPIDGNNNLFRNLNDGKIQIKNIDPTEGCISTSTTKTKKKSWRPW